MLTQTQYDLIVDAIRYGLPAKYHELVDALIETIKLAAEAKTRLKKLRRLNDAI